MMDRNRDARRGSMAAVNGNGNSNGGLSRRRQQRSTNLRDSPEEDGAVETQESSRLRDRGVKKDRDRDRDRSSSRSKRRRGERWIHGSNREEGDESSEETMEDDDDEEEDASVAVRLPPAANSSAMPSSSIQQLSHHHVRKSGFSASKPSRPPPASWKVADEMIGVSIPRKARTSSLKRAQEYSVSGGGGSGELIPRQASTSPARPSPSSTTAISPPSSTNASVRKKKPISGTKHRPPKMAKSPSSIQEIEIEVAEVLYGMTRQAPPPATTKQEGNKVESKDTNGLSTDAKSRVSSPNSISQTLVASQPSVVPSNLPMVATAPKRKRPRLRFDEESPTSPASSVAPSTKMDSEMPQKTEEGYSPRSEKNISASPAVENGIGSVELSGPVDTQQDLAKPETGNRGSAADCGEQGKVKEEVATLSSKSKEASCVESNVNSEATTAAATKAASAKESPREEKFSIDLMAFPLPEKSSSDRDGLSDFVSDHKSLGPEKKEIANGEAEKVEKASKQAGTSDRQNAGNFLSDEFELKKQTSKEKIPDLQLDLEKHDKDSLSLSSSGKQQLQQAPVQQQKSGRMEPKQENTAPSATLPLPVPNAGWPGGFPPFGYMGMLPSQQAVVPMDGNSGAAKTVQPPHFLQPQLRHKRCATHCYIAQNIAYHQQISRMNQFWSTPAAAAAAAAAAAVGVAPLYGAKQYNLNAVPPSESAAILGSPLQGGFPPRSMGPLQDKSTPAVAMAYTGPPPKEKSSATGAANSNNYMEAAQRKQFLLQQTPQPGSSAAPPNMMQHGPAFIFQPAMANRPGGPAKSTPGTTGNAAQSAAFAGSAAAAGSGSAGHPATTMSFNYAGMSPSDAQYMAILQNNAILPNNAYPFPIAAAQIGAPPSYRGGASPTQALPFFNGPFYSSQIVPSQQQQIMQQQQHQQQQHQQQQQQQQQPPAHSQQGHQNPSTSSGSSSSQKHTQQSQRVPGIGAPVAPPAGSNTRGFPASKQQLHLLPHQARQLESDTGCEDSPSTADSSRASQAQKGLYGQNFTMPMHSQNFALISPSAAAFTAGGSSAAGGNHSESKQSGAHQHPAVKMELTPSQAQAAQAYAMSFASFTGSAAAQGFDFSAIVQNPALMQNLTEGAKHGYQIPAAAVAAVAAQAAQHKKDHHEDGKSRGDSAAANANAATEEAKITVVGGGKIAGTLSFSRLDNDPTIPNFTTILADANHRMLNGGRPMIPPSSAAPTSSSVAATTTTSSPSSQQSQQQQMIQFQKQHHRLVQVQQQLQQHQHQHLQLQQQMSSSRPSKSSVAHNGSSNVISDRLQAGSASMAARFPQGGLTGFPPSLIQGSSGGSAQPPQWKTSGRAATPAPASSATSSSSSAKNQLPQQQQQQQQMSRSQQQPLLNPGAHQTQISFGVTSSNKPSSNPSLSSATTAAIAAGSPQNSVSKSSAAAGAVASSDSPRASSSLKSGQPPASVLPTLPLQQQQSAAAAAAAKNSSSAATGLKSSPITNNNRNMNSILGHPHITPSNSSNNKQQQQQQQQSQQQQQQLQKQSFQQPQLFFNNAYFQAQTSHSNAAAAGYFQQQRRQSEQQQQQQQNSTTPGMLTLCPSSITRSGANASSDPAKAAAAAAASSIKGLSAPTQAGILQHAAQYTAATSMAPHPFMSTAFPYINAMPSSVSVKPASSTSDQKQSTTGNDNMHACWKPEKR